MKTPRIDDFYVDPKAPRLKTPMDDLPRILPPDARRRDVTTSSSREVVTSPSHDVVKSISHDVTKSTSQQFTTSRSHDVTGFDINRKGTSHDTLRLSPDESKAIDQLVAVCKWDFDLAVSKNDICRVALHVV